MESLLTRRRFLLLMAGSAVTGTASWAIAKPVLINPCRVAIPPELAASPWLQKVWSGLDPARVWDCHVHLAGTGDGGSGIVIGPQLSSYLHPVQYGQRLFYMNAGCAQNEAGQVDRSYAARLINLTEAMPTGFKVLLFAFDRFHDETGRPRDEQLSFYVPDRYAHQLAAAHPSRFEWAASVHPYRPDALDALHSAVTDGARAVKWLPSAMGMDPASQRCDAFYRALATANLPLIVHCGSEQAVKGEHRQHLNNPLRLRRALDAGVRVVIAHCASVGQDIDLDRGQAGPAVSSFRLFSRIMAEPRSNGLFFGDISAVTQRNRPLSVLKTLLERADWHGRLLHGSDYPLPGILPLTTPTTLAKAGLLPAAAVPDLKQVREHNPLLFDLALKRLLSWKGLSFPASVFHTQQFFQKASL
jgi:mannonate dehydratase